MSNLHVQCSEPAAKLPLSHLEWSIAWRHCVAWLNLPRKGKPYTFKHQNSAFDNNEILPPLKFLMDSLPSLYLHSSIFPQLFRENTQFNFPASHWLLLRYCWHCWHWSLPKASFELCKEFLTSNIHLWPCLQSMGAFFFTGKAPTLKSYFGERQPKLTRHDRRKAP